MLGRAALIGVHAPHAGWFDEPRRAPIVRATPGSYTGTVGVGPNPGGQNPPGWQYVSGGLLLFQPGDVKHSNNKYAGNQHNVLMVP